MPVLPARKRAVGGGDSSSPSSMRERTASVPGHRGMSEQHEDGSGTRWVFVRQYATRGNAGRNGGLGGRGLENWWGGSPAESDSTPVSVQHTPPTSNKANRSADLALVGSKRLAKTVTIQLTQVVSEEMAPLLLPAEHARLYPTPPWISLVNSLIRLRSALNVLHFFLSWIRAVEQWIRLFSSCLPFSGCRANFSLCKPSLANNRAIFRRRFSSVVQ